MERLVACQNERPIPLGYFGQEHVQVVRKKAREKGRLLTGEQIDQLKTGHPDWRWNEGKFFGQIPQITAQYTINIEGRTFPVEQQYLYCSHCDGWVVLLGGTTGLTYYKDFMTKGISCGICHEELAEKPSGRYID